MIDYQYDGAGLVMAEGNTISGSGGPAVTAFWRYPNGKVSDVQYPDGISIHRDYTARGQLNTVKDSLSSQPVIGYTYRADGKVDHADYGNGITTQFGYDDRGFTKLVRHTTSSGQDLSRRDYYRDERDRITSFQKGNNNPAEPDGEWPRRPLLV
jgi:hypothetical protein